MSSGSGSNNEKGLFYSTVRFFPRIFGAPSGKCPGNFFDGLKENGMITNKTLQGTEREDSNAGL